MRFCSRLRGRFTGVPVSDADAILSRPQVLESLRRREDPFDVVVIGGGSTGCGVALECASRGVSCLVLEGGDFSGGTSSKSTKLIHGGVRYLEAAFKNMDLSMLSLVYDGLRERRYMLQAGKGLLSYQIGILIPLNYNPFRAIYTIAGCKTYEMLARISSGGKLDVSPARLLGRTTAESVCSVGRNYPLSLLYYDGAHIDYRTVFHVLNTACMPSYIPNYRSAIAINHARVKKFNTTGGAVRSVTASVYDPVSQTHEELEIPGKQFVDCTGPFSDLNRVTWGDEMEAKIVTASGVHLTFPRSILGDSAVGLLQPKTDRGSVAFVLPFRHHVIAGTTDSKEDIDGDSMTCKPQVSRDEASYLIGEVASLLKVNPEGLIPQITSAWKGFRPLIPREGGGNSKDFLRSHIVRRDGPNRWALLGGKWTSHRAMAQDLVDALKPNIASISLQLPWAAAIPSMKVEGKRSINSIVSRLMGEGVTPECAERMAKTLGWHALDAQRIYGNDLDNTSQVLSSAELSWFVDKEAATSSADILVRRSGLAQLDVELARRELECVSKFLTSRFGWDTKKILFDRQQCIKELNSMSSPFLE